MVEFSVWANFIHLFDLSYQLEKQVQYNIAEQYTNQEMLIIPEYLSSTPFLIEFESLNLYFILGIVNHCLTFWSFLLWSLYFLSFEL